MTEGWKSGNEKGEEEKPDPERIAAENRTEAANVTEEFEVFELDGTKLSYDPLHNLLKSISNDPEIPQGTVATYALGYKLVVPDKENDVSNIAVSNYHDLLKQRAALPEEFRKDFDNKSFKWKRSGYWGKIAIFQREDFWRNICDTSHPLSKYRDEWESLQEKIKEEQLPDEYAHAVARGEIVNPRAELEIIEDDDDSESTRAEKISALRKLLNKFPSIGDKKVEGKSKTSERGARLKINLNNRSKELDAEAGKLGWVEKKFRALGERYNKLSFREKLGVGIALGLGAGGLATVSMPAALACMGGIAIQRTAGLASMFLKFEKNAQDGKWKKEKAIGKAILYTAGMTAGMLLLAEGVKEGINYADQHNWGEATLEWLKSHWPFSHTPETTKYVPVKIETAPSLNEMLNVSEKLAVPPSTQTLESLDVQSSIQPLETPAPEIPQVSVNASAGRGYEFMIKRLWEQLQDKNIDPSTFDSDSDIHRLLSADAHSIDKVAHQIAADPNHGFFRADGTSVRIDLSTQMTIGADGQIHISDAAHPDIVQAPAHVPVTPAYHPEAPAAQTEVPVSAHAEVAPQAHAEPLNVEAAHVENAEVPASAHESGPISAHNGSEVSETSTPTVDTHVATVEPRLSTPETGAIEGNIINRFGVSVSPREPHFYFDTGAKHIFIYGGSPLEKANAIQQHLIVHPDNIVYSSDTSGVYRIPWHFVNGKAMPGMPVQTRGLFGFFKSFMKAPDPSEFKRFIK